MNKLYVHQNSIQEYLYLFVVDCQFVWSLIRIKSNKNKNNVNTSKDTRKDSLNKLDSNKSDIDKDDI